MLRTLDEVLDCIRRHHRDHPGILKKTILVEMEEEGPELGEVRVVDLDIRDGQVVLLVGEMK